MCYQLLLQHYFEAFVLSCRYQANTLCVLLVVLYASAEHPVCRLVYLSFVPVELQR
jgi:hypothetical protein